MFLVFPACLLAVEQTRTNQRGILYQCAGGRECQGRSAVFAKRVLPFVAMRSRLIKSNSNEMYIDRVCQHHFWHTHTHKKAHLHAFTQIRKRMLVCIIALVPRCWMIEKKNQVPHHCQNQPCLKHYQQHLPSDKLFALCLALNNTEEKN